MRLRASFLLVLVLWVGAAVARPTGVILLRHAEKPGEESSVHLSPRGEERARALVQFLAHAPTWFTNGGPLVLVAARIAPSGHGCRPYETLEPLAKQLNLPIQTPFSADDYAALARRVLRDPAYDGKTVVICWTHEFLPGLAEALGVKPKPPAWKGSVYDRVWRISWTDKQASLDSLPQHLLPDDSPR